MAISLIYFSKSILPNLVGELRDLFKLIFIGLTIFLLTILIKIYFLNIYFQENIIAALIARAFCIISLYILLTLINNLNYLSKLKSLLIKSLLIITIKSLLKDEN